MVVDIPLDPSLGVAVFTDGSASHRDRSGGYGWVALDAFDGIYTGHGSDSDTTISQMELMAPTDALIQLALAFGAIDILVYSDSQYVVKGCNDRTRARRANKRWWKDLDEAIAFHGNVVFEHVRGHSDNVYNEMADQLAGEARKDGSNGVSR